MIITATIQRKDGREDTLSWARFCDSSGGLIRFYSGADSLIPQEAIYPITEIKRVMLMKEADHVDR